MSNSTPQTQVLQMREYSPTKDIKLKATTTNIPVGSEILVMLMPMDKHNHAFHNTSGQDIYKHVTAPVTQDGNKHVVKYIFTVEQLAKDLHIDLDKIGYVHCYLDRNNDHEVQGNEMVHFKVRAQWHDPVDNPQLCLYTMSGGNIVVPYWNVFGYVRNGTKHQGVDLFAKPGTDVYACVDGIVVRNEVASSLYGRVITIKAKNPDYVRSRKRPYTLKYPQNHEIEHGPGFNENGDFYFFYAHLIESHVQQWQEVKAGDVIGKTGTSGFGTTKDPHLHFEILNIQQIGGMNNRVNPAFYVDFKFPESISGNEQEIQTRTKDGLPNHSVWGDPSHAR